MDFYQTLSPNLYKLLWNNGLPFFYLRIFLQYQHEYLIVVERVQTKGVTKFSRASYI